MAQESGSVTPSLEAQISVHLVSGDIVDCIIDTGFDGALMLPRELVEAVGLTVLGAEEIELAGDVRTWVDISLATVRWLSEDREAEVLISDGNDSLVGTELLRGTQLTIDYSAYTVSIAKS